MKKVAIFGCKKTTSLLFNSLKDITDIHSVITVHPDVAKKNHIADFYSLIEYKKEVNFYYECSEYSLNNPDDQKSIIQENMDLAFVMGWQRIIPKVILDSFSIGVFGMHGSSMNLPEGRGRSPLNWSLIEGRKEFYTNLFKYNPGVDDGDILGTKRFSISQEDDVETLHYKNYLSMISLIKENISFLLNDNFILKKQKDVAPTYYPKRSPEDGALDLDLHIDQVVGLIKAQTKPFSGAFSFLEDSKIIFWRASVFQYAEENSDFKDYPNGTILEIFSDTSFLMKLEGGLIIIRDFDLLESLKRGQILKTPKELIKKFPKNPQGFHDIAD